MEYLACLAYQENVARMEIQDCLELMVCQAGPGLMGFQDWMAYQVCDGVLFSYKCNLFNKNAFFLSEHGGGLVSNHARNINC